MGNAIQSVLSTGSGGTIIEAECHISNGLPVIIIVGLGNKAVDEAKERVRSAFSSAHLSMPKKRIIINLAPADVPKESTSLDLAIAVAILSASGQIKHEFTQQEAIIGELGLDGTIRPVRGIIGKILAGKKRGISTFIIPQQNAPQAQLIPHISFLAIENLRQLYTILEGPILPSQANEKIPLPSPSAELDFRLSDVIGQENAKRALEVAAAGGHNIILNGPPGTGKSMLAKSLVSILPSLNAEEMLEITHLHSLSSHDFDQLITTRPFRSPHHSASHVSIVGGGHSLRPGEITLSHRGVLFFDEFPEFDRRTIEALRQPLEDKTITVSRAKDSASYPADFIFVATANPCPCGFFGTKKECRCTPHQILRYQQKMSGPIMDRIDLHVVVETIEHEKLLQITNSKAEDTKIKKRIENARKQQALRFRSNTKLNAHMSNNDIKQLAYLIPAAKQIIDQAATRLNISSRSYMRTIKVARTIADIMESPTIEVAHITEALQYRMPNRGHEL